jgi:hypothetical protein
MNCKKCGNKLSGFCSTTTCEDCLRGKVPIHAIGDAEKPDVTTDHNRYKELSRYLDLLKMLLGFQITVFGLGSIILWVGVGANLGGGLVSGVWIFGWPVLAGCCLVLGWICGMASIQFVLAVKDTAENTAKLVELMRPDKHSEV